MTTSNVRNQPDIKPKEIRVLPQGDAKLPLPPVRRQTRVSCKNWLKKFHVLLVRKKVFNLH